MFHDLGPALPLLFLALRHLDGQDQFGLAALVFEDHRGEDHRRRTFFFALEREDQALVRDDLAVDALRRENSSGKIAGVWVTLHVDAQNAAGPHVELADRRREMLRWKPPRELLRIGPRPVDELAGRIEDARRRERPVRPRSDGATCAFVHASCPSFAALADGVPSDRSFAPRTRDNAPPSRRLPRDAAL